MDFKLQQPSLAGMPCGPEKMVIDILPNLVYVVGECSDWTPVTVLASFQGFSSSPHKNSTELLILTGGFPLLMSNSLNKEMQQTIKGLNERCN